MKKNILFALAVILLAGVIAVTRVMTRTEGATARVEITDADELPDAEQNQTPELDPADERRDDTNG